jgi:hypothetical protein
LLLGGCDTLVKVLDVFGLFNVKLLRDVKVRRQPKELGKVSEPDVEPSAICHPHKEFLLLIKEESGVELCDDRLVLVVAKL